jgi:hypothetical protein
MTRGLVQRGAAALAASILLVGAAPARAAPDWDIVGIRLGMSPEQVRAALSEHAPKAEVSESRQQFTFNDGVGQQQLPDFLGSITARLGAATSALAHPGSSGDAETLEVMFSAPPMQQRVIRVIRTLVLQDNPPPMERALASVTQKYGEPPKIREANYGRGLVARWVEPGKTVCGDTAPTSQDAWQAPPVDNAPGGLSQYDAWHRRKLAPADASHCSAALVVNLVTRAPGEPLVREMKLVMTDPGYAVPAMRATAQQLAELQAKARKARMDSGTAPKL